MGVIVVQGEEGLRSFAFTPMGVSVQGDLHPWAGRACGGVPHQCVLACHVSNVAVRVKSAPSLLEVRFNPQAHGHKPCKHHGPFTEVAEGEKETTHAHEGREVEQFQGAVGDSFHHVWSIMCVCQRNLRMA